MVICNLNDKEKTMIPLLRNLFHGQRRAKSPANPTRPRSLRPTFESLEDRVVPSTCYVIGKGDINFGFEIKGTFYGTLRYCINQANAHSGSTILFRHGLTGTINLYSALNITQGVEIDGPGQNVITLSGRNLNQVFNISGTGQVTINDLTIDNGLATSRPGGGAIEDFLAPLVLSRVTFANNQAIDGGALFSGGSTTIQDCIFTGNSAFAGPSTPVRTVAGGAIFSKEESLTVINTQFNDNYALGFSGATGSLNSDIGRARGGAVACVLDRGTDTFIGCTFMGNSARGAANCSGGSGNYSIGDGQGGAIAIDACAVEVDNQSTFTNNYAQGGAGSDAPGSGGGRIGMALGGAIEVDQGGQLTVNDSTFTANRAVGANYGVGLGNTVMNEGVGGAINDEGIDTFLSVAGCTFTGNTAEGGISGYRTATGGYYGSNGVGGAINLGLSASGDISGGTTFSDNKARGHDGTGDGPGGYALGGAIDTFPNFLTISDTTFLNNRAQGGNGGPLGGAGTYAFGGGLNAEGGSLNLWDLTFTSNRAIGGVGSGSGHSGGGGLGGAMSLHLTVTTADSLNLQSNWALGGNASGGANGGIAYGGGIYTISNYFVMISDSTVTLNNAQGGFGGASPAGGYGGGIVDFNSPGVLQLIGNWTPTNNHASTDGQDIYPS
jgi:hypothetical protein